MYVKLFPFKPISCLLFLVLLLFLLAGCTLMQTREESLAARKTIVLAGIVSTDPAEGDMPVVVAAYTGRGSSTDIVHFVMLHEPGPYELMVPEGVHNIVAFGDRNKNLIYEKGESAAQILAAEEVSPLVGGVVGNLDLVVTDPTPTKIDLPLGFHIPPKTYGRFHSTCPGAMAQLDDVLFSDEYGKKGFWTPLEFFREVGGNVYFLEEYDPKKIPILFIHGASGSPQNWLEFYSGIDRNIYQPWIYYYPSGATIDSMSYLLYWKIQNLQVKYKFNQLCIAAHSMGGLVARSFFINFGQLFPSINCFISISTPWGGEPFAETGVKYSPAVVPAWRDMQPQSSFLQALYTREMPPSVNHYLFFGHRGNRNILRPNNDKVVTLSSQLDQRAQKDAVMLYGYNEDHVSILSSRQVLSQFNAILADTYEKETGPGMATGNRIRVDFAFDIAEAEPRPMPGLFIRPVDEKEAGTWLYMSPDDSGREFGPFPSGDYQVSMLAHGFMPDPVSRLVHIDEGTVPNLAYTLRPAGAIRGYVKKYRQAEIQLGESPRPDSDIEIESLRLTGENINRTLIPLQGEASYPVQYLKREDYFADGIFFFFDLPEGEYELTVYAKNHKPYHGRCKVVPGHYQGVEIISLEKSTGEDE